MNNIRKIIEERLDNARLDYQYHKYHNLEDSRILRDLECEMNTYQDCLNLMQPRTEQEILNDFEKLGYQFIDFTFCYHLTKDMGAICKTIILNKNTPSYRCVIDNCSTRLLAGEIDIQEHKLLNELFSVWGWL